MTQKVYTAAELAKFNVANLNKVANEELGLNLREGLTKAQVKKAILAYQKGEEIPANMLAAVEVKEEVAPVVAEPEVAPSEDVKPEEPAKSEKPAKEEKKVVGEILNITDCEVGDVIRYLSSKKLYVVAEKVEDAPKPYLLLVSATQVYNSYKRTFNVNRVLKADEVSEEAYAKMLEEFKSEKNVQRDSLLAKAAKLVEARKKLAEEKLAKEAEKASKKDEKKEEAVQEEEAKKEDVPADDKKEEKGDK